MLGFFFSFFLKASLKHIKLDCVVLLSLHKSFLLRLTIKIVELTFCKRRTLVESFWWTATFDFVDFFYHQFTAIVRNCTNCSRVSKSESGNRWARLCILLSTESTPLGFKVTFTATTQIIWTHGLILCCYDMEDLFQESGKL